MKAGNLFRVFVRDPLGSLVKRPADQVPALDVLRTIAVLCVLAMHLTSVYVTQSGAPNAFSKLTFVRGGWMGVDLFFVLSGYLIGFQLWRELRAEGKINVKRFVLRRGLRIWPLFAFFLVFTIACLGRGGFPFGKWWSDPLFITDYVNKGVVMGSWSLCTEEQFYLLAPLALLIGCSVAMPLENYRKYLWGLLLLLPAIRAITWVHLAGSLTAVNPRLWQHYIYTPIHTHSDGLVMGLLIANYRVAGSSSRFRGVFASPMPFILAVAGCLLLKRLDHQIFDFTGLALVFGAAVSFLLARPQLWPAVLGHRFFYVVSRLSFGMYLNHEYFHANVVRFALRHLPGAQRLPALNEALALSLLAVISAGLAVCTYCLIEHPFLRLRSRWLSHKIAAPVLQNEPQRRPRMNHADLENAPQFA